MSASDQLVSNARRHAAGFTGRDMPTPPAMGLAVVACMDSRIDLFAVLGLAVGDCHLLRNAGGVVTDDVIRSLAISQRLLGTREVMLIHHTQCGLLSITEDGFKDQIAAETGIRPPWAVESFKDLEGDVRQSIGRVKASPFVPYRDHVRGFVYAVETGVLTEVE